MAETTTEILMQFIPVGEPALKAECTTAITADDKLAQMEIPGFAAGFAPGRYFLVDTFKFGVELRDGETDSHNRAMKSLKALARGKPLRPADQEHLNAHLLKAKEAADKSGVAGTGAVKQSTQAFSRWRSATDDSWKKSASQHPYSAKVDEFSFTRKIDRASITLFDYCCKQKSFAFASMVKRKSAPVAGSDLPQGQSYLRLDFKDVVVSSLKWNDNDVIEESCTFHAKKMRAMFWTEKKMGIQSPVNVLAFLNAANWELQVAPAATGK